jgi:hypothetical protein
LWERFHWGPQDTILLSPKELEQLFLCIQQEDISKNYVEDMGGKPDFERHEKQLLIEQAKKDASKNKGVKKPIKESKWGL